jgi:hypothetical protein
MVFWINAPAEEAKKSSSYLSREFAVTLPQKTLLDESEVME